MIGIGTNVLLGWLLDEQEWVKADQSQFRVVAELLEDGYATIFVNHIVLAETAWVLLTSLRQSRDVVASIVERLLASANVVLDQREAVVAALAGFKAGKPDFADHLIGHVNRMAGCETTISFDKGTRGSDLFRYLPSRPATR